MTREEAEEYAKNMTYRDAVCNALQGKCVPYRKATLIKLYELLDRLEQEPCEDAISRQGAIDLCDKRTKYDIQYEYYEGKKHIRGWDEGRIINFTKLMQLPSVKPQSKTGHWIRVDKNKLRCSECEVIHLIAQYPNGKIDWCPNCGAKMIGE